MAQYVKRLFDGDRKAIFSFTAKIASTTAETFNVDASGLNARNDGTACSFINIKIINRLFFFNNIFNFFSIHWINIKFSMMKIRF